MELLSSKPIFLQIKDYYENLINDGSLKENDEMPSVREVALFFRINPNTVQRAFTLMVEDGYLTNIPKKGFYVKRRESDKKILIANSINYLKANGVSKEEIINYLKEEEDHDSN